METHTTSAPIAHAFDPSAWLKTFESIGGGHVLTAAAVHLGFTVHGRSAEDQRLARCMIDALTVEQTESLADHLRSREV